MMDASKARKVAGKALKDARAFFRIDPNWKITLDFSGLGEDTPASNNVNFAYRQAHITLDLNQTEGERELRANVAHEVAHVFLASFLRFKSDVMAHLDVSEDDFPHTLGFGFFVANEQTTRALEDLFMRERPA